MTSRRARTFVYALQIAATAAFGLVALAAAAEQFLSHRYYTYLYYVHHPERLIGKEAGWVYLHAWRGQVHLQVVRPLFEVQPPSPLGGEVRPPWGLLWNVPQQLPERWRRHRHAYAGRRTLDRPAAKPLFQGFGFLFAFETFKESQGYRHTGRPVDDWRKVWPITGPEADAHKHRWRLLDVIVPHWFIALLAAALAWLTSRPLRAGWRARRRARRGLCPACGYDLRGSPGGACPECGAATPGALPAAGT